MIHNLITKWIYLINTCNLSSNTYLIIWWNLLAIKYQTQLFNVIITNTPDTFFIINCINIYMYHKVTDQYSCPNYTYLKSAHKL